MEALSCNRLPCSCLVLLAVALGAARAQIRGCSLSSLTEPSSLRDAVASTITGGGDSSEPPDNLTIHDQNVVCLVTAETRDEYLFSSVVVVFSCVGALGAGSPLGATCAPSNYTAQFDFECRGSPPDLAWEESETPFQFGGGTSLTYFDPPDANLSTSLESFCSLCVDPGRAIPQPGSGNPIPVDPITHCAACDDSCLESPNGQELCYGSLQGTCCNVFEDSLCALECSPGRQPELQADGRTLVCGAPVVSPTMSVRMGGDPHYSVLLQTGQLLCFSVHGEKGFSFNLISSDLLQMNARFIQDPVREEITWIGSLGVVVKDTPNPYRKSNITKLRFEAAERKVYIGDKASLVAQRVEKLTFRNGKLTISHVQGLKKIKRHNILVDMQDIGLSFSVRFVKDHLDLSWEKISNQLGEPHGMIGQFFREGNEIDETRKLLLLPNLDPVPVMRRKVWQFMEREVPDDQLCWVAMNPGYQGKRLIEGHYLDYLVDDVLSQDFNL